MINGESSARGFVNADGAYLDKGRKEEADDQIE
jgi:hypothetical protein